MKSFYVLLILGSLAALFLSNVSAQMAGNDNEVSASQHSELRRLMNGRGCFGRVKNKKQEKRCLKSKQCEVRNKMCVKKQLGGEKKPIDDTPGGKKEKSEQVKSIWRQAVQTQINQGKQLCNKLNKFEKDFKKTNSMGGQEGSEFQNVFGIPNSIDDMAEIPFGALTWENRDDGIWDLGCNAAIRAMEFAQSMYCSYCGVEGNGNPTVYSAACESAIRSLRESMSSCVSSCNSLGEGHKLCEDAYRKVEHCP